MDNNQKLKKIKGTSMGYNNHRSSMIK